MVCRRKVTQRWANLVLRTALRGLTLLLTALSLGMPAAPLLAGELATIAQREMPAPGIETYRNIQRGGPFPFEKDGVVFGNRERILPLQKRGFYREYTVKTPGLRGRGAQRIVCGGPATAPEVCYYTVDHYASFRMIVP